MAVMPPGGGGPGAPGPAAMLGPFLQSLLQGFMQGAMMDPQSAQGQGYTSGQKLAQLFRKGQRGPAATGGGGGGQPPTPWPGAPQPMPLPTPVPPGMMPAPGPQQPGIMPPGVQPIPPAPLTPPPPPGFPPAPPGHAYVDLPTYPPQIGLQGPDGRVIPLGPMPGWAPPPSEVEFLSGGQGGQGPGPYQGSTVPAPGQGLRASGPPASDQGFVVTAPNGQQVRLTKDEFAAYSRDKDGFWLDYQGGKFVR